MARYRLIISLILMSILIPTLAFVFILGSAHADSKSSYKESHIQLVAVQMKIDIDDYLSPDAFENRIRGIMSTVADMTDRSLPTLVTFPEGIGFMLAAQGINKEDLKGAVSIFSAIRYYVSSSLSSNSEDGGSFQRPPALELYLSRNGEIAETYFNLFSELSKEYGIYIVAGSVVLPRYEIENGSVLWQEGYKEDIIYNSSFLFAPDGRVMGRQDKVHLTDFEINDLKLSAGSINDINAFDTPLGRVGIAICLDGFMEDVLTTLKRKGADILVQPSASPGSWNFKRQAEWMMSTHMRTYVQGMFAYGINPMINGIIWDLSFYGQSSIIARNPTGGKGDTASQGKLGYRDLGPRPGFIEVASTDNSDEIIIAIVPKPAER